MGKYIFLVIATFSLLVSCQSTTTENDCTTDECLKQQAYDKVIAIHDEVMPMLSQIAELQGEIENKMKNSSDSAAMNQYLGVMQELDRADESMWVWMRGFNSDVEPLSTTEALDYLKAEEEKITKVAENIKASIADADKLLAE